MAGAASGREKGLRVDGVAGVKGHVLVDGFLVAVSYLLSDLDDQYRRVIKQVVFQLATAYSTLMHRTRAHGNLNIETLALDALPLGLLGLGSLLLDALPLGLLGLGFKRSKTLNLAQVNLGHVLPFSQSTHNCVCKLYYNIFTIPSMPCTLVMMKKFQVITLFPEMFDGVLNSSMLWKAQKQEAAEFNLINLRDYGVGPRKQVDDTPYGGGDGMLLKPEPLFAAVEAAKKNDPTAKVLLMTPRGQQWRQSLAQSYADSDTGYIFICGRYEGYDERIVSLVDEQVRVGEYVLTGGELPAMTIIDSIVRLIPGVLGGEASAEIESFSDGETLEFPQYTKPAEFNGMSVPDVLLSGNHAEIARWRAENSHKA